MFQKLGPISKIRVALEQIRNLVSTDGYQPHKHYMRGPGPKAKARQAKTANRAK